MHCRGDLSGRQRISFVPWRNLFAVMWSYCTSTTSTGRTGSQALDFSVAHRLWPPGAFPGEAGRLDQILQKFRELAAILGRDRRCKADMVEFAPLVVQAKQQRTHKPLAFEITETADYAIRRAPAASPDN